MNKILVFRNGYRFLSNFWPAKVTLDGHEYSSTEHAYQAAKNFSQEHRKKIREAEKPVDAKRLGQKIMMRPDWDQVKIIVMKDLVSQKFAHEELKEKLLATGDAYLEEGNSWGDVFWGVCNGIGQNHLGKILMEVRDKIKSKD